MFYISLKKAAEISGYTQDHLGYLIREKKLGGKKIGRDWFTTEKALKVYLLNKKFLPVEDIFSFKKKSKLSFLFAGVIVLVVVIGAVSIFKSSVYSRTSSGDFKDKTELQKQEVIINQQGGEKIQGFEITSYSLNEDGDIETSIQPKQY